MKPEDVERLSVKQLQDELRKRGAFVYGKKAVLAERLIAYINNDNFQIKVGDVPRVEPDFLIPTEEQFKDINASMTLPQVTKKHLDLFMKKFQVERDIGLSMYQTGFLKWVRYCKSDAHYFKAVVHAQMFKELTYNVYIKVDLSVIIVNSHCDCVAGGGGSAHCKHVVVVLWGIHEMSCQGSMVRRKAATSKLQTFHRPKKEYQGTPLKAFELKKPQRVHPYHFDPRPVKYRQLDINSRVANLVISVTSNMPLKQLVPPANPYAIDLDHLYSKSTMLDRFLEAHKLKNVSDEDVCDIEVKTRGQHTNPFWHVVKSVRMSSKHFYSICHVQSDKAARALCERMLCPSSVMTDAMIHGIVNEPIAVKKFMQRYGPHQDQMAPQECGTFIFKDYPYLCTSPDRLFCRVTLLEVKCPFVPRMQKINPQTVPFLYCDNKGELALKPENDFMYQIQGQLLGTGRQYCELIVYTHVDLKVVTVHRDENFIGKMVEKLEAFKDKFFFPAMLKKRFYRNYYDYRF